MTFREIIIILQSILSIVFLITAVLSRDIDYKTYYVAFANFSVLCVILNVITGKEK